VTPLHRGSQTPLHEPEVSLEKFRKDLPSFTWTFYLFVFLTSPEPSFAVLALSVDGFLFHTLLSVVSIGLFCMFLLNDILPTWWIRP